MIFKDLLGQELKVGDIITYPVRRGSSMWMSFGKIYHLEEKEVKRYWSFELIKIVDCKVVVKSDSTFCVNWDWTKKSHKKFIADQIDKGHIPANLDYCHILTPKKCGVGLDRAIKISSEQLPKPLYEVLVNEKWFVDKIRLL